jgi:hypothetical protein
MSGAREGHWITEPGLRRQEHVPSGHEPLLLSARISGMISSGAGGMKSAERPKSQ